MNISNTTSRKLQIILNRRSSKRDVYVLRMAYIYAKRVDWMLSGDDGEDTLVERLQEELQALKAKYPSGKFTFKEKDVYFDKECERYMLKDA